MTEICEDCGKPLDDEHHEFNRKLDAIGDLLQGASIADCMSILAIQAGRVIGDIPIDLRTQFLLEFIAHVSDEVCTIDDEEEAVGPIN